jgi:sugar (pentulose or hexulose) kinase
MSADTPVLCGIHDSNASLYPYIRARHEPFSVVSTGTWVVVLSVGHDGVHLKGDRDDLMNVDALGNPVPSARFMGGREYELIAGGNKIPPSSADANEVFAENLMLLPAVEPGSGPFQGQEGRWIPFEPAPTSGARMVALSYYLALVTAECLIIIGAKGDAIIEGPFAKNRYYCDMLQARTNRPVVSSATATGTSIGAAMLFVDENGHDLDASSHTIDPDYLEKLQRYAERWQAALSKENAR